MSDSAADVIRRDKHSAPASTKNRWTILPGMPDVEIQTLETKWIEAGHAFPAKLKELLHETAGITSPMQLDLAFTEIDGDIWRAGAASGELQDDWVVFDLQAEVPGKGAPRSLYFDEPNALERVGTALIFRIRHKERTWWQRFRDRWR